MLKVKDDFSGKIRLDTATFPNTVLDENTPQEALQEFFQSDTGKQYIEEAAPLSLPANQ